MGEEPLPDLNISRLNGCHQRNLRFLNTTRSEGGTYHDDMTKDAYTGCQVVVSLRGAKTLEIRLRLRETSEQPLQALNIPRVKELVEPNHRLLHRGRKMGSEHGQNTTTASARTIQLRLAAPQASKYSATRRLGSPSCKE